VGYDEKLVMDTLVSIAKRRNVDIEKDHLFRRTAADTILEKRDLTSGARRRKI